MRAVRVDRRVSEMVMRTGEMRGDVGKVKYGTIKVVDETLGIKCYFNLQIKKQTQIKPLKIGCA